MAGVTELTQNSKYSFRFHVLSLPHTVTTPEYNACAYTMKVLKFCKMMRARGHYIIHYGHKDSVVDADEHVTLLDNDDLLKAYGSYNWRKEFFKHNVNDYANTKFQEVGTVEVLKRLSGAELRNPNDNRKDFVLAFWGIGHKKICDAAKATGKVFICEPGIGYSGSFMDFRVFESYAWMHTTYGKQNISNPSWYQVVIPNYFDPEEFHYSPIKSDYYLCLGRINTCKGVHIAIQAAKKLGIKLVLAGQGDIRKDLGITDIPENIIYYGYADVEARKKLMAYAKGFILLSSYIEPFGGAAVEALMSGTPVICPDWGVFNETVPHGLVGYRVRTFDQICWAIKNISNINPANCRAWAINNYSLAKVGKMYETYFIQLADVWERGWYQEHPERTELDWLEKSYPSPTGGLEKSTPDEPPYLEFENTESENFNLSEISKLKEILEIKKLETQKMYQISEIVKVSEDTRPKIAIWSENEWAFGRIYEALIKYIPTYNFEIFNWGSVERNNFLIENFKNYKHILCNTAIFNPNVKIFENLKTNVEFLSKIICISHCPKFNQERFNESIDGLNKEFYKYVKFGSISKEGILSFVSTYNMNLSDISWLPAGVDTDDFKFSELRSENNSLKTLGFIMRDPENLEARTVKNYTMCQEIAHKTQMNMKVITGHSIKEKSNIYENIDMLICCSKYEAGPLGIMEAASLGIPVISTKVGNISELESLKFFSSVEEAVDIINNFKANPEELISYTKNVSNEVIQKFNWSTLAEKYWKPFFENKPYTILPSFKDLNKSPEVSKTFKVGIYTEKEWAMGRIYKSVAKYITKIRPDISVEFLNWSDANETGKFKKYKNYDVLISTTVPYSSKYNFYDNINNDILFVSRLLSNTHFPIVNHLYFNENIDKLNSELYKYAHFGSQDKDGVDNFANHYKGANFVWLPAGVDTEIFKPLSNLEKDYKLETLGFIGTPHLVQEHHYNNKRPFMFKEIAEKSNCKSHYIHGKSINDGNKIYLDSQGNPIDMLICCSLIESGPLGPLEAITCGIPVISTKVGNLKEIKSMIFFESIEEAVQIINDFKANPELLKSYTKDLYMEVTEKFNWESLVRNFWIPKIEEVNICKNIVEKEMILKTKTNKIAIWAEDFWAFGRLHNDLIQTFQKLNYNNYTFTLYDWRDGSKNSELKQNWHNYDLIIATPAIYRSNSMFKSHFNNDKILSKVLCVGHFPIINHPYFSESLDGLNSSQLSKIHYGNVCKSGVLNYRDTYKDLSLLYWLPAGVNSDIFIPKIKKIYKLENIGYFGRPTTEENINRAENKRPQMFEIIARETGLKPMFIIDRHYNEGPKLYEEPEIDLFIYTSKYEGGPLGVFEAAACGVPVISTKTGNMPELNSLMTFETVEEAVQIITVFKENPSIMAEYVTKLQEEVLQKFEWRILVEKYWKPIIDKILIQNLQK
jgi:glycosyltransferase involved in cell wall biosynthesis